MFHVKTSVKPSPIHGLGLFADQNIKKGEIIYEPDPALDLLLTQDEFNQLPPTERSHISHYGYFDKKLKKWHLAHDDIRFCNHKKASNLTLKDGKLIAKKDIKKGEELTQDYNEFEELRGELK
ncbi:MAG: SET domain-containing protein [Nanoarchaeota archaeon]|nr:SET domain-containing protein [Nanoarchaeota archaeon]